MDSAQRCQRIPGGVRGHPIASAILGTRISSATLVPIGPAVDIAHPAGDFFSVMTVCPFFQAPRP